MKNIRIGLVVTVIFNSLLLITFLTDGEDIYVQKFCLTCLVIEVLLGLILLTFWVFNIKNKNKRKKDIK